MANLTPNLRGSRSLYRLEFVAPDGVGAFTPLKPLYYKFRKIVKYIVLGVSILVCKLLQKVV